MPVEIDPLELGFHRPFTVEVSETLKIRNPSSQPVAFKVKTTAPKQYCVRPNSGRIEPGKEVEVSVILQAMKTEPPPDAKCKDKFLVQSLPIDGDKVFTNLASIWESVDRSQVQERKIRVIFLSPGAGSSSNSFLATPNRSSMSNGHHESPDVAPPAYSSPSNYKNEAETKSIKSEMSEDKEPKDAGMSGEEGIISSLAGTVAKKAELTYEELKAQLAFAQQQLAHYTDGQPSGIRQRKPPGTEPSSAPVAVQQQVAQAVRSGTEGVPLKITAMLCLTCFMIAYFFF